jgi:Ca2+-binding RTX toxin-like protein
MMPSQQLISCSRNVAMIAVLAVPLAPLVLTAPVRASVTTTVAGTSLAVTSDGADRIEIGCPAGNVKINGADPAGVPIDCAFLTRVRVVGGPGTNTIDLAPLTPDALPAVEDITVSGGEGDDTITGSQLGDRLLWRDGDGNDRIDGGPGDDTTVVKGAHSAGDAFTVKPNGRRVRFERTNLDRFRLDLGKIETLAMNGGGGDDTIRGRSGLASLIGLRMNGGAGDDTLIGSDGDDVMDAGAGDDTMVCGAGHDVMEGNRGDDRMVWNDGDGSDVMDGEAGRDTAEVNGAASGENFSVRPNGRRVRLDRRNLAAFKLDIGTTERLLVNAGAGDDRISGRKDLAGLTAGNFNGQDGDDTITGTGSADVLTGGRGTDRIRARDRAADKVRCGRGVDVARVDRRDRVRGCDVVLKRALAGLVR